MDTMGNKLIMRDKFIGALDEALAGENVFVSVDSLMKAVDRLMDEGFGLVDEREMDAGKDCRIMCKPGDKVFEVSSDIHGHAYVHEAEVLEVSNQRIWLDSNYYDVDDVGKLLFLNREDAEVYMKSSEYLAERVTVVLHLNVSDEAKRELLVGMFEAGQEFVEDSGERSIRLTEKRTDFWKFDVFDRNHEWMYATSAFQWMLASEILEGKLLPAAMAKEKGVSELISDATDKRAKGYGLDKLAKDLNFDGGKVHELDLS